MEMEMLTRAQREQKKQSEMTGNLERSIAMEVRTVEGEERTVELSWSSEKPVSRWWGDEILDHSPGCADLKRIQEIGCILFNHHRDTVIGKPVKVWIEDNRGKAKIQFDDDEQSEIIYKKVQSGSLRGVSVGYAVTNWETVEAGKKSIDGRFKGPCEIGKRWYPYEISIVSVPADETVGVGRSLEEKHNMGRSLDFFSRQLQINKNREREE